MNNINNIDFMSMLPESLSGDTDMKAFAEAVNEQLTKVLQETEKANIYYFIEKQNSDVLDVLAEDLKVDWYYTAYDVETKRNIIKTAIKVHKYKGTPFAIKQAINGAWPGSSIEEWQDYSGSPYTFRLNLATEKNDITADSLKRVQHEIDYYKNVRSALGYMQATVNNRGSLKTASAVTLKMDLKINAKEAENLGV